MNYLKTLVENVCCSQKNSEKNIAKNIRPRIKIKNSLEQKLINLNKDYIDKTLITKFETGQICEFICQTDQKILLLDLDRTLIYYTNQGFRMRPHLKNFLGLAAKSYRICIFTAGTQEYLSQILKLINQNDGGFQYLSGFLTRKNCLTAKTGEGESVYIKDLSILKNCSIKKIIIVDDNPISYILNPENGVPIIPFEGQTPDNHLLHLFHTLNQIKDYDDVRDYIRGRYNFQSSFFNSLSYKLELQAHVDDNKSVQ